jgi:transcriptional regulator with XRE-family HTH domain
MQELDKAAMGTRIRQIRLEASFRQWELAKLLGTTQSAIHKYEHGVVPEPKRLVALARIGGTSVEWILTGRHWENGSTEQRRLNPDLLRTAELLHDVADRDSVEQALRIVRDAAHALENGDEPDASADLSREQSSEMLRLLRSACRIRDAVVQRILRDTDGRLSASPVLGEAEGNGDAKPDPATP